jgi:hypothetical protein
LQESAKIALLTDLVRESSWFWRTGRLGVFDLIGAAALIVLIGGERHADRFAAAKSQMR